MRLLPRSATYTLPLASRGTAIECGTSNCPCPAPFLPFPQDLMNLPALIELRHPRVAVAVGNENVARGIPGHVGRPVEVVARHTGSRGRAATPPSTSASFTPAAAAPGARRDSRADRVHRLRLAAQRERDPRPPCVEFQDHVGAAIHHPDVVPAVHLHGLREQESVHALADLADELSRHGVNSNSREPPCVKMRDAPAVASLWPPVRV